eukprot:4115995-Prymnesium_polylepis.1
MICARAHAAQVDAQRGFRGARARGEPIGCECSEPTRFEQRGGGPAARVLHESCTRRRRGAWRCGWRWCGGGVGRGAH